MSADRPVQIDEIHAYVDGRLPPERRAAVEAHLAAHPEQARRAQDYRNIDESLHALFDPVLDEPVPARLLASTTRHRGPSGRAIAAMLVALVIGGAAGWTLRGGVDEPAALTVSFVDRAMTAHTVYVPEVRHPVEVEADQQSHLVRWLSKRLGGEVRTPDLGAVGYSLRGGRLLPGERGPAAQFMYENDRGERLTLYVKTGDPNNRDTAFRYQPGEGGTGAIWWIDGPFGYALTGAGDRESLERIAHLVYEQLKP